LTRTEGRIRGAPAMRRCLRFTQIIIIGVG
jgi:hypothetical protein